MKIFILGLPKSGRTSLAKSLAECEGFHYIPAMDWLKATFRTPHKNEDEQEYYHHMMAYLSERYKINPYIIAENIEDIIKSCSNNKAFIIDGLSNPQNLIKLFDYNKDMIVILNRLDNNNDCFDADNIAINVIRDYCFWLSSVNLLPKDRWQEFNFKTSEEDPHFFKTLSNKNTVNIVKSISKVKSVLFEVIKNLL